MKNENLVSNELIRIKLSPFDRLSVPALALRHRDCSDEGHAEGSMAPQPLQPPKYSAMKSREMYIFFQTVSPTSSCHVVQWMPQDTQENLVPPSNNVIIM